MIISHILHIKSFHYKNFQTMQRLQHKKITDKTTTTENFFSDLMWHQMNKKIDHFAPTFTIRLVRLGIQEAHCDFTSNDHVKKLHI